VPGFNAASTGAKIGDSGGGCGVGGAGGGTDGMGGGGIFGDDAELLTACTLPILLLCTSYRLHQIKRNFE